MSPPSAPRLLLAATDQGVRILILDRPERRNALSTALTENLLGELRRADLDPDIGAVVVAATGPVFCAGADLGEFKGDRANAQAEERRGDLYLELQLVFDELQVPVVCAVQGAAVGAGASLAIAADLTLMGESASLSYPEVIHGMVPSLMIAHLQHRVGRKQAFELLAVGESLSAADAFAAGLANRVVPDPDLLSTAQALARALARRDRPAMRETKRLFVRYADLPLADALRAARADSRVRKVAPAASHAGCGSRA
jgi:enoyl-CoA hydratase/carnithine racemase